LNGPEHIGAGALEIRALNVLAEHFLGCPLVLLDLHSRGKAQAASRDERESFHHRIFTHERANQIAQLVFCYVDVAISRDLLDVRFTSRRGLPGRDRSAHISSCAWCPKSQPESARGRHPRGRVSRCLPSASSRSNRSTAERSAVPGSQRDTEGKSARGRHPRGRVSRCLPSASFRSKRCDAERSAVYGSQGEH
jgi:hypothetical protein